LSICKGIICTYNGIWIDSPHQADKILINKIGKLDIMFYGADEKRIYSITNKRTSTFF